MEKNLHILLCEDEESLGMLVREYLEAKGYNAELFLDGEAGYRAFMKKKYDMCLLDVMMPKMDGFALAKEIRLVNSEVPIIFLTAKSSQADLLEGFSAGGDDYIPKPFSIQEVIARVRAVMRRFTPAETPVSNMLECGRLKIDLETKMVYKDGEKVVFSKKEFEVLSLLASNPGKIYSREDLISELWKDAPYVLDRTVDVHIARIRSKLGDCKGYLVNRSGYGYIFNAVK